MRELTAERLRELLHYSPDTGLFTWRVRAAVVVTIGDVAGTTDRAGYIRIGVDGGIYRAHRLAVLYMTGSWPKEEVDHRDGDKANNRFANLREVGRAANQQNLRRSHSRNSTGYLGVSFHAKCQRWVARIWLNGKNSHLGLFDTPELAHAAYVAAKREHHEGCTI